MKAIRALTAEMLSAIGSPLASGLVWLKPTVTPMMATRNWQINMPKAPQTRRGRRPSFSTAQKESGVEQTLTRVKIREIKLTPVHCCIICREVPKIVRRMLEDCLKREPLKQFAQLSKKPALGMTLRSYSSLAMISASSFWMYSDSAG